MRINGGLVVKSFGRIAFLVSSKERYALSRCITNVFAGGGICIAAFVLGSSTRAYANGFYSVSDIRHNHSPTIFVQGNTADSNEQSADTSQDGQSENNSQGDSSSKPWSSILRDLVITGGILTFLVKWPFEQWGLRREARRKFSQTVTDHISTLASEHYWSLANYAGVLAGLLEEYIEQYSYHLILIWENQDDLREKLDEIAYEKMKTCFPYFCHLIGLFYEFQFKEGNTYLLTDHQAGKICHQLYNSFLQSFNNDERLLEKFADFYALEIHIDSLNSKTDNSDQRSKTPDNNTSNKEISQEKKIKKIYEIFPVDLTEDIIKRHSELDQGRQLWHQWLRYELENVIQAADALRAYNELLNHELANLYRDWFNKNWFSETITFGWWAHLTKSTFGEWPNVITEQSEITIQQVSLQPVLLSPLGAAVSTNLQEQASLEAESDSKSSIESDSKGSTGSDLESSTESDRFLVDDKQNIRSLLNQISNILEITKSQQKDNEDLKKED
ncbi:hypothetical protein [Leptothoe spongobia]|uniref:Uncharacterized protein n=1 Tax=Leptothoe spongobia TAU-MAC 1115 TaxID=1967444 RepID=A0A947DE72_9CYAN|nr:hypothetical protein [Leptothoe spongobia]MBT9315413.1 hypothetical protein [Leptothoe spongobia TAU-MAC 1115]